MMNYFCCLILIFISATSLAQSRELSGTVTAEGKPVPFANLYLENSNIGTTCNAMGEFRLSKIPKEKSLLVISAVGFKTLRFEISDSTNLSNHQNFILEITSDQLQEILIIDQQSGLTRQTPYNISTIQMQGIENKGNPNGLMGVLREVPGVYGAEFGHGIVKPFIRGLGFSRIVTIYQGNKLENHQWGADHGLGINELGIKRVDVIKGPASVLYGSGALGGVLLTSDDDHYLRKDNFTGNLGTTFNSVSNGLRFYSSIGRTFKNNIFLATDIAYETHADYKNGNDRIIGNSRFNTKTLRLHTGLEQENFQNKLSFTYNDQNLGIILDEEMDNLKTLATTRNDRDMHLPFQEVEDYLISYNQSTKSPKLETFLHLSHHLNNRKEIETARELVDLGLIQNNTFYNARIGIPLGKTKNSFGIQGSFLQNKNLEGALEFLIPDAEIFENGLYYLLSIDHKSYFIQGAIRYDHRKVTADASSDQLVADGFILPGDPENKKLTRSFEGFTGSLGVTRKIERNHTLKLNLSSGFRAPDLAELFSNGPHPGTSRFEKGNDGFGREQSLQADFNYNFSKTRFQGNFSAFGSLIDNYIFFSATNETLPPEDLEVWSYLQANAIFYGLEFELRHTWLRENRLETILTGAIVRAKDRKTENNLTFIPPDNFNFKTGYYSLKNRSLYVFSKFRLVGEQNRVGLNEEKTAGYTLFDIGATRGFDLGDYTLDAGITVHNILDNNYVDHLSILRTFDVTSPGRNVMLNVKYNF